MINLVIAQAKNVAALLMALSASFGIIIYQHDEEAHIEVIPMDAPTNTISSVMLSPLNPTDEEWIALNAYAEARGEGYDGMVAVTNVVINRVNDREFPNTIKDVIVQPKQFSWLNGNKSRVIEIKEEKMYNTALRIGELAVANKLVDYSKGARFYANVAKVDTTRHKWVAEYTILNKVGNHTLMDKPEYVEKLRVKNKPLKKQVKQVKA
jgi:spore germination cell wall hydrolase CwlJ-like protein